MHKYNNRKPSTLYHLEPMNVFSGSVESLTSYLTRLSEAHCLPVESMVDEIIWPASTLEDKACKYRGMFYKDYAKTINGVGVYAEKFSFILEQLTLRTELRYLTMLPLEGVIDSVGKGLLKKRKEWCPICYAGQLKEHGFMFDHLRWSLTVVDRCEKHKIRLHGNCHCCGKEQWLLVRYTPLGHCIHCGAVLAEAYESRDSSNDIIEVDEWHDWLERNLDILFKMSIDLDRKYTGDEFCAAVTKIVNDVSNGNALQLDRKLGFGISTIAQWRRGRNRPRFDYLLQFAFRLGADFIDVLQYANKGECDVFIKTDSTHPIVNVSRGERKNHDHKKIENELDRVLEKKIKKSVAMIMKEFNVSRGYLNYRFSDKVSKISENYKKYIKSEREKKFNKKADSIRRAVNKLHKQDIYPCRREVFKIAEGVNANLIANHRLREVWHDEIIKLGFL